MKKICVITGTRAEYGLLKPLLIEFKKSKAIKLQIVATGSHLSTHHGYTLSEIMDDGFKVDAQIEMLVDSDSPKVNCCQFRSTTKESFSIVNHCSNMG